MTAADWLTPGHETGAVFIPSERLGWPQRVVAIGVVAFLTFGAGAGLYVVAVAVGKAVGL